MIRNVLDGVRRDLRIAALYALFGVTWILLSDWAVEQALSDRAWIARAQTYKGIAFVALGTLLVHLLLRGDLKRERAARALQQETEIRYRRLFDNSPDAILLTDTQGTVYAANPAACRLFRRTEEEIRALGRAGLADTSDPRLEPALRERQRSGYFHGYLSFLLPNGEKFEGEATSALYRDDPVGVRTSLFIRDVTERVRTDKELQRAYATLFTAMDQSQAGIAIADADGGVQFINQSGLEIRGRPDRELAVGIGDYVAYWNLFHLDGTRMKNEEVPLARAILTGEANRLEYVVRREDRDLVVLTNAAPVRDGDGQVVGGVAVFLDVTEAKRAEERLRRLNRTYLLLSQCNQAIVRERDVANLFGEVCGSAVEQGGFLMAWVGLVGEERTVRTVACAGNGSDYVAGLAIRLDDPTSSGGPTGTAIKSGRPSVCNDIAGDARMAPWRDTALRHGYRSSAALPIIVDGDSVGCLHLYASQPAFFDDEEMRLLEEMAGDLGFAMEFARRTEERRQADADRREALQQVRALNAELERRVEERTAQLTAANRELEAFSYSVSHDLRAPLRAVDGWAGVLAEDFGEALGDEGLAVLARLRAAGRRMGDLIEDLLQLSRVSRVALEARSLDAGEVARTAWRDLADAAGDRARLVVHEVPRCHADPSLLRQVLDNLFVNALKFSAPRETPVIEFGGEVRGSEAVFWVKDNGVGFDPAHADKLFQPFQRLHDAREFPGTGIGLAIVQRIVRLHGGRVWAESRPDQGAAFYFSLPTETA